MSKSWEDNNSGGGDDRRARETWGRRTLVCWTLSVAACAPQLGTDTSEVAVIDLIERDNRPDNQEYFVECSNGLTWNLSDRNVHDDYGNGEFRIREVRYGADAVLSGGGVGYLQNARGDAGSNWIAGGHGWVGDVQALSISPQLEPGESTSASEVNARFAVIGYLRDDANAVVVMDFDVAFDCETYTELVTVTALDSFDLNFEYTAVALGAGDCKLSGGYHTVNGVASYGDRCGLSDQYSHLPASQVLTLEGDTHTQTVTTTATGLSDTLVRDRASGYMKAYAVRPGRAVAIGDEWSVTNTYRLDVLP